MTTETEKTLLDLTSFGWKLDAEGYWFKPREPEEAPYPEDWE